ncbi:MAG: DUF4743 domain-containing protein [Planctomycetota bacterium]
MLSSARALGYMPGIGYLDRTLACHHADLAAFVPWFVAGLPVGRVHRERAKRLCTVASPFRRVGDRIELRGEDFFTRSEALAGFLDHLVANGELRPPLGEAYPICAGLGATPLLQIDRTAVTWFGVRAFGVHLNGYVRSRGTVQLWIARRSLRKRTFPGHLDNFVAGGQPIGSDAQQTLIKECHEEAGLPATLATRAVPVGTIGYVQQDGLSLKPDSMACFDLELPASFEPRAVDGEVENFTLWPAAEVAASLRSADLWKANSALVTLHFLLRFGLLDGELRAGDRWSLWRAVHGELP